MLSLNKNDSLNLTKSNPTLKRVRVGLGWNPNETKGGYDFDLDVTAFVLKTVGQSADGKIINQVISESYVCFYNQLKTPNDSVVHSADNLEGGSDGDDETIIVDLNKLPSEAVEISFIVTIYEHEKRKQNFGQVPNSYIKIYDDETGQVICAFDLKEQFTTETAVWFGSMDKTNDEWTFKAVGQGSNLDLADYMQGYGIKVK